VHRGLVLALKDEPHPVAPVRPDGVRVDLHAGEQLKGLDQQVRILRLELLSIGNSKTQFQPNALDLRRQCFNEVGVKFYWFYRFFLFTYSIFIPFSQLTAIFFFPVKCIIFQFWCNPQHDMWITT